MDTEELIRKCKAITLKEEETDKISFIGTMRRKGEKLAAHCLIRKILRSREVNTEGLRTSMQQVWKSVREIKVESPGDNIFVFKFPSEIEKKIVLYGGPWHFDKALMILTEPSGVGDIKHQSFQYTSFWIQLYNVPLMCLDKDAI